jgi:hypothetical protein
MREPEKRIRGRELEQFHAVTLAVDEEPVTLVGPIGAVDELVRLARVEAEREERPLRVLARD